MGVLDFFVPVKSPAQQDMQMLHRIRAQHVAQNTVLANQIRAYLRENGIIMPKQIRSLLQEVPPFWRMPKTA